MMDHILQFDWCASKPDLVFVTDEDLANSVTERILRNNFRDPFISSDSDEEPPNIDWKELLSKNKDTSKNHRLFVPCLPNNFQYPKLSALTKYQHFQCLKVLCAENPHILPSEHLPKPSKNDFKIFKDLKATYEKEQAEFIEWAKTQWTNKHCINAMRPNHIVEQVYEAKFKMKANEMECYPKMYDMAAQIPLETSNNNFKMVLTTDLKSVHIKMLPLIECKSITQKLMITNECPVPEPCTKHPCRFILPNEKTVSILPLTEIQRELAQYALDNNATYIASENALKTLLETERSWDITLSVVGVIGPDGEKTNVVVMGDEFSTNKEPAVMRTYRAFKHLLQHTLIPKSEKSKLNYKDLNESTVRKSKSKSIFNEDPDTSSDEEPDTSSDEDDIGLCIDEGQTSEQPSTSREVKKRKVETQKTKLTKSKDSNQKNQKSGKGDAGLYSCSCKETIFERPPPRSFKKWQVRNKNTKENYDIIIHCSHKVRDNSAEVILEPIPEYQLELGASAQSKGKIRSLALSLLLRKNASLLNVRIDGETGEVATFEKITKEEFKAKHGDCTDDICNVLHTALNQLQGLLPGTYILRHEPNHGKNAILYVAKPSIRSMLELKFDSTQLNEMDEAPYLRTPPVLTPLLLPYHKFRRILPCAFTYNEKQVMRQQKKNLKGKNPPPTAQKDEEEKEGVRAKAPKRKRKKKKNYYKS